MVKYNGVLPSPMSDGIVYMCLVCSYVATVLSSSVSNNILVVVMDFVCGNEFESQQREPIEK